MAAETYALEDFIADLERITREETVAHTITERVAPLLARLAKNPAAIAPPYRTAPPGQRGRYMLHRAPAFNITSVIWRPGDGAAAHDHATWGVIGVVDNEIEETRYAIHERPGQPPRLEALRRVRHGPGAVSRLVPGDEIHAMHNPTDRDTLEIHVYGKDLVGLRRRTWTHEGRETPLVTAKYLNC